MFNRPTSPWLDEGSAGARWDADRDPQSRLWLLWVALILPLLAIVGRGAQLQLTLRDGFAAEFSQTTETREEIPARDGRIQGADGSLLADNAVRFDVAVYYPAIQNPAADDWITAKAKPRLSKAEQRDKTKLAAGKRLVLAEQAILWQRLADLAERPLNDVIEARQRIQTRVERVKESVHRHHHERQMEVELSKSVLADGDASPWIVGWTRLQRQLTQLPERTSGPRLITEELDYHAVITDISAEMKAEIEGHPDRYPYTRVLVQTRRTYPQGELASHLIGARQPLSDEQLQARQKSFPEGDPLDYRVGDPCGMSGLERTYDGHLKGIRGQRVLVKNRRGEIIETRIVREPRHGRDLDLTLDPELQRRAEQLLDRALLIVKPAGSADPETNIGALREVTCPQGGCLVAIDVHTGAIVAAAAAPRFDLNLLVNPDSSRWDDAVSDPRSPFLSRVTQMALPPGSVFKVVTAVAAVESGTMPPEASFHCRGFLDRPNEYRCLTFRHQGVGHHDVTLADALCRSCNVYFFTAARRMGPQTLVDWAREFGIGQPTGVDLPSEAAGNLPAPDQPLATGQRRKAWKPGNTLGLAIGQWELTVTPLQMARVMAAIANDGYLVTPHLAADSGPLSIEKGESVPTRLHHPEPHPISGLHRRTLEHVREGLTMVVHDPHGTGYKTVRMKEVTIAGKTGTAETNGVDHAWFAGYVPAERPRIAFVVVLQNGGGGGSVAGPVAHDFVKSLVELGLVTRTADLVSDRPQHRRSINR